MASGVYSIIRAHVICHHEVDIKHDAAVARVENGSTESTTRTYNTDNMFHAYCRQLLVLPCLRWETIEPVAT